jgi:hypothetical protein
LRSLGGPKAGLTEKQMGVLPDALGQEPGFRLAALSEGGREKSNAHFGQTRKVEATVITSRSPIHVLGGVEQPRQGHIV